MSVPPKSQAPVVCGVAEHEHLIDACLFELREARENEGCPYSLTVFRRCDRERREQCNIVCAPLNMTARKDHVANDLRVDDCNQRQHIRPIVEQLAHNRNEVLIGECQRIDRDDRRDIVRRAFSYFDIVLHCGPTQTLG